MEVEHAQALFSYFGLSVNEKELKLLSQNNIQSVGTKEVTLKSTQGVGAYKNASFLSHRAHFSTTTVGEEANITSAKAYKNASIFTHIGDFFTTTIAAEAERIWNVIVSGIKSLAKWVMTEVQSLWKSAVDAVNGIADFIATFLKKFWSNTSEFVRRMNQVKDNVKNHVADATIKAADKLKDVALGRIKDVLKKEGKIIDGMSEQKIRAEWEEYMKAHPMTPEEKAEADSLLNEENGGNADQEEKAEADHGFN